MIERTIGAAARSPHIEDSTAARVPPGFPETINRVHGSDDRECRTDSPVAAARRCRHADRQRRAAAEPRPQAADPRHARRRHAPALFARGQRALEAALLCRPAGSGSGGAAGNAADRGGHARPARRQGGDECTRRACRDWSRLQRQVSGGGRRRLLHDRLLAHRATHGGRSRGEHRVAHPPGPDEGQPHRRRPGGTRGGDRALPRRHRPRPAR